jgi:hypothetical protein
MIGVENETRTPWRHGVHICWLIEAGYGKYVENMVIYGKYMGHMVIYGCLPSGNLTICY